ncbi:MAG: RluA family pseudouridine synthase [Myxococcaceae bacterium]
MRRSLTVEREGALGAFVQQSLELSERDAATLVERGAVYLKGRRCREPQTPLRPGDPIMVILEESGHASLSAPSGGFHVRIIFEDDFVLAVDKPSGMVAQPTPSGRESSLLDWATTHLGQEAGLVHRLDKETSGVTVFGKTSLATAAMAEAFREGKVRKRYLALCGAAISAEGVVDLPLSPDPSRPGRWRASRTANGTPAVTRYQRLGQGDGFAIIALYPETGRTHQLRAHLTALAAPILGDRRYGGAEAAAGLPAPRCLLHAQTLILPHAETGASLALTSELPKDMRAFFERVGCSAPSGSWW